MDRNPTLKPERVVTTPDQRSQEVRISSPIGGGDLQRRVHVKAPEGVSVKKTGMGKWTLTWQAPITAPTEVRFAIEAVAGAQKLTCTLLPPEVPGAE